MNTFSRKSRAGIAAIIYLFVLTEGLHAQALKFPNSASSVIIGDLDVTGNQVTVEALIRMEKNSAGGDVVSKHNNPLNVNYLLRPLTFELTTYLSGSSGPTHFLQMFNPFKLSLNRWYHIAGTYDGTRAKYYVNGCLVIDTPFTGNLYQNNCLATIGNKANCECEPFSGMISEVRIWKVARSQQQIAENMLTLPDPTGQRGLLACYTFDGNYVNRQGDNRWNGKKTGTPLFSSDDASIQSFEVTGIQTNNTDCEKSRNGVITVFASRPDAVYSLDRSHYQSANQFVSLDAGNYTVYARDSEGCLVTAGATVGNNHGLVALSQTFSLCREGSYYGHTGAGTYTDTIYAASGCDTLRTLHLTQNMQSITTDNRIICEGETYQGHQSSGEYTDTLVAANGCDSIHVLQLTVLSRPHPDLGANRSICKGDSINLFPGSFDAYLWQDGSSENHLTVTSPGVYSVRVSNTCGSEQQKLIVTDGVCGLYFPNAFTPNGDGRNDSFRPVIFNLHDFRWKIFNRFGQLVFETKEPAKGWDGRLNGQLQNAGVYIWACSYTRNDKVEVRKGSMVLIR